MTLVIEHLQHIEDGWRRLRAAADQLGPEGLERATSAGWSAKEMLSHVAFWEECAVPVVTQMLRDAPSPWTYPDGWAFASGFEPGDEPWPSDAVHNAREAAWARDKPAAQILERMDRAHAWAVWAISSISDEEAATDTFRHWLRDCKAHFEEHGAELAELLSGTR